MKRETKRTIHQSIFMLSGFVCCLYASTNWFVLAGLVFTSLFYWFMLLRNFRILMSISIHHHFHGNMGNNSDRIISTCNDMRVWWTVIFMVVIALNVVQYTHLDYPDVKHKLGLTLASLTMLVYINSVSDHLRDLIYKLKALK